MRRAGGSLFLFALLAACSSTDAPSATPGTTPHRDGSAPDRSSTVVPGEVGIAHQSAPFQVILASNWGGTTPFSTARGWGDFGLGGFDGFRGEVVMDGEPYVVEKDGVPRVPADTETSLYMVVTKFSPDATHAIAGPIGFQDLTGTHLKTLLVDSNGMYALKLRGHFSMVQARSFQGWSPPYPGVDVLGPGQVMFNLHNVDGEIIAYYLPPVADTFCKLGGACAQPGFHLHYLNDDRKAGGHLLDCTLDSGTLEVTTLRELRLYDSTGAYESLRAP